MTKEMFLRRIPAMILSGLLAISNPGLTAYAESYPSVSADTEEAYTEGTVLTDAEGAVRNEEILPANGDLTADEMQYDLTAEQTADEEAADLQIPGEEELLSDGVTSEAEPVAAEEPSPFEQTARLDDVQIVVTADAGVFAPGTVLEIQKITDEEIEQKVETAEGIVPSEQTIVQHSLYSFSGAEMNGSANVLIEEAGLSELQEEYPDSEISSCLYRWDSELEDVEIIPADIDVQKDQAAFTMSSLTVYDLMTVIYMPETAEAPEEIVSLAGADPSEAAVLEQSATVGGVTVTVRYEAGAFPEDAELSVKKVSAETAGAVDEAVADVREEQDGQDGDETKSDEQDVIASYTFDISMLDPEGSELQPAEGFDVQVSFALAEAAEEGIEASVYHIHEDDSGMTAETLDIVSESGDTVTALTDSFSLYNVTLAAVGAGQTVSISYVDAKGNAKGPVDCRPVTEKNLDNGWYAVTEDVSFSENMEVSGNVNLILCDGKTLRPNLGIYVKQDASLTIWAQSTGKDMGKLVADITSSYDYAAIGGKDDKFAGAITINGGNITAKARINRDHPGSAGIGAGKNGPGYTGITINGGVVEALGSCRAAGIGGTEKTTSMGPIEITGGTVTVTGGAGGIYGGAGIGGGSHCTYSGELIIKITGGDVTVTGGDTGIGLGYYSEGSVSLTIENAVVNVTSTKQCGIQVDTVKITSSQVTVVGYTYGISSTNKVTIDGGKKKESLIRLTGRSGAGINGIKLTIDGEGTVNALGAIAGIYVTEVTINGGEVISTCANHEYPGIQSKRLTINGGDVTAQGGTHTSNSSHKDNGGAGICLAANGTLTINGGMLKATGGGKDGCGGAGIGGNYSCSGTTTHVIINGGTVIAKGGPKAAGIGGGAEGFWGGGGEGCDEVQINGGVVIAQSGGGKSSAIGHGDNDKEYGHIKFKNGMWVHAGWSEEEALKNDPFTAEGRESACQYRHYARIDGECDHPWEPVKDSELKTIRFTEITKTWHLRAPCAYCNQVFAGEPHDFDDAGVCMVCGYQEDGNRITFDANGGTGAMEDRFIAKGRAMALPECLFTGPDGRIFSGWKIGEKTYQEAEPVTIDADVNAVAQWKAPYVITFDPGDGTGEMEPGEAGVGEKYPLPPCKFTEPEWHDFVGWQVGQDQEHLKQPLETITVEGNTTVTARWERPEYAITFDSYGGSKVSNQHALKGAHAMVPDPAPTMEGREFLGWRLDGEDFDFENTPITRDITLVAHWSNEWVDLQKEIDEAEDGATITLTGNVTAREDDVVLTIPDGKSITIDLAGCTLNRNLDEAEEEGNVITVNGGLTVTDSVGGGVITGGSNTGTGGGIFVEGTFTLDGGTVSGNKGTYGGGVQIGFGATFTMNGGTISGNEATYGGGVYSEDEFTMKAGTIRENKADNKGGGVYSESDFEMKGGKICDNTADDEGGGVYSEADLTLTNAEISGNYAEWDGGGVSICGSGSFVMTNSRITGNTADVDGGGVLIYGESSFTMNSGSISDNISDERGGGVASYGDSQFIMTGGVISGNKASVGGGGVYTESDFTMKDGEISGNTANDLGGGVDCDGDFTMSGGRITGNRIDNPDKLEDKVGGGGVYIEWGHTFRLSGSPVIKDNMDDKGDSNVYLEKDTLITVDDALANSDPIGIGMQEPGVFTDGLPGNGTEDNFTSDDTAYAVSENDAGEARLVKGVTVTFEANGGTGSMEKQVLPIGEQKALRANAFTREDATFKGWNTKADGSGTEYDDKALAAFNEDTTLYAQWYLHVTLTATTADATYNGKVQTAEGYTTGLTDGTAVEASFTGVSARGSGTDAGTYDVTFAGATPGETIDTSGRYMVTNLVPGTLTIAPKDLTVTTASASKPYDGTALVKTDGTAIEGLVNGETASVDCTGSQTAVGSSDNTYTIDWVSAKASNYTITKETPGTLKVTANDTAIVLTAASAQKTYDGEPLSDGSVTVSGLPEGFTVSASASGTRTDAGVTENVVDDGYVIKNARGKVVTTFFTNITKENGTLTIDPAKITITAHDGMGPDITDASSLDYEISGGIVEADKDGLGIRLVLGTPTGGTLKTYPVEVVYTPDDNYEISTVDGKYTVSLNGGFTAHGYSGVYDGVPHSIDVEVHDTEGFDIFFANEKLNSKEELDAYLQAHPDEDHSRTDVGTTTVYYYLVTDKEFLSGSKDVVITPKKVTVTAEAKEKTYGDEDPELTYTAEGLEYDDTLTGSLTREAGENVGSYAIQKGTLDGGKNYTIAYTGADLTIGKRTVGLEWADAAFTYNGESQVPTATVTGLVNGDKVEATVNGEQVDAGKGYTAAADSLTGEKAGNYALPEDGSVLTRSFSIAPKELTVTTASASKAYDGTALVKTDGAAIEGLVEGETAVVTATGSQTAVGSSDNTYTITWGSAKASNYKITKENLGTLTVTANETEIVLTAASAQKTYDGTALYDGRVTVNGLPDGFAISVTASGTLTDAGQTDNVVGDPVITNAAGEDVTAFFTNVRKENGALTIVPAAITITANDGMGPDITDASSLGYEISGGIVEADKDKLGIRLVLGTPAGGTLKTYPVEVVYTPDDNYEISTVDGKYIVSLNGGFTAHGYSGVYDGVPHSIDVETQDTEGFDILFANEKLNSEAELDAYLKAHPEEDHSRTDVGTTTVYYYVVTDAEFFSGSKDIVITPKNVTVTADAKEKIYGDADPELTYKVDGLEYDDTLTGSLTREAGENVGSYAVLQGTLDAGSNYKISFTGAELTINKRTVGLAWTGDSLTYNGQNQAPGATVTGLVNGDEIEATVNGDKVDAGEGYMAAADSLTGEKAGNYALPEDKSVTTHAFSIAPKELTVTTASASKPYDGTALVKTDGARITGLVKSETADVKANGSQTEVGSSDNTYELTWGTAKASNYKIAKEDLGTLTVTANDAEIVLMAASVEKTYDGTPLSASTVTASGLPEGFTVSASAAGTITNAGQAENVVSDGYVIKNAAGKDVTAYFTNVQKENGTLTIRPAAITITANDGMGPDITDASSLDYEISGGIVEKDRAGLQVQLQLGTPEDTLPKVYPVEVSCTPNANYVITTVNGRYTVHEDVEFTAHGYSGAYDGVEHGIDVEVTKGDPEVVFADEKLDTLQAIREYAAAHSGDNYGGKDAGTYTFYYYVMLDDGTFASGSKKIVITPKELQVTADAKEKTYGDADPALTYVAEGLEYDDTLTGTLVRENGENVGSHAILQGTLDAGKNYTITYKGADLTINKRTVPVTADAKTKTEGDVDPALTYTAENLVEGDTLSGALARESGEAAGRYAILQGTLNAGENYSIAYTGADLTITAKPTPTPTEAPEPTQKPEDTVTPTPTEKPVDTVTPTPTEAPVDTVTPTPTEAPEDTVTPTPTEKPVDTVTPTPTEKPVDTVTPTPTEAPVDTVTPTPTEAPEDTVTPTPTEKPVDTVTPTPTEAPEDTVTPTPTEAPEDTVTPTPTEEPEEITYTFVSGDGGKWKKGNTATLDFVVKRNMDDSQTFSLFTGIEIDGDEVSADDYDAEAGSVKISLKPSFLKTLSKGKHTIKALFTDGSAEAEFRVNTDSSDDSGSDDDNSGSTGRGSGSSLSDDADAGAARTGDDSQPFQWLMLLLLSMAAIMVTGLTLRKKQK